MNKQTIVIAVLGTAVVLLGAFLLKVPATVTNTVREQLGSSVGTEHTNAENFYNITTFSCPKIYQAGATKNASTTYYLMASTTFGTYGAYTVVIATSTKPTNCN